MKVNILMSTYNGEKYLAEQLDSILAQTFTDWLLLVRDDASADGTLDILEAYAANDKRIRLIKGENVGVIRSFFELVKAETADYYFFCDQDDVWLPEKLEVMLEEAGKYPYLSNEPALFYTDLNIVDQNLRQISDSMLRDLSGPASHSLFQEINRNSITGCSSMINHALAERWTSTDAIVMHDWHLAQLAAAYHRLIFINRSLINYRQHENNVIGANTIAVSEKINNIIENRGYFFSNWRLLVRNQRQLAKLLEQSDLPADSRQIVEDYADILTFPFSKRMALVKKYHLRKDEGVNFRLKEFLIRTKFRYKAYLKRIEREKQL